MSSDPGYGTRVISINASSGAFIQILGTRLSRRVEIIEDQSGGAVGQGLQVQLPIFNSDDPSVWTWGPTRTYYPQSEPVIFSDVAGGLLGAPTTIANGPGTIAGIGVTPATPICNIRSGGTATVVDVTEFS